MIMITTYINLLAKSTGRTYIESQKFHYMAGTKTQKHEQSFCGFKETRHFVKLPVGSPLLTAFYLQRW